MRMTKARRQAETSAATAEFARKSEPATRRQVEATLRTLLRNAEFYESHGLARAGARCREIASEVEALRESPTRLAEGVASRA